MTRRRGFAACIALAALAPLSLRAAEAKAALVRSTAADGPLAVETVDFTPRFLDFHRAAQGADAERRWALWQERYGFAAVPPTPEGLATARRLLDAAWPRYEGILPLVERGAAALEPRPLDVLRRVAALLELREPLAVQVVAYVGAFDGNAFTAGTADRPVVALPVEMPPAERALVTAHELTHAVHMRLAGLADGWERSIAQTVLQEGLAVHAVRALAPGRADREYIEHRPGWFDDAMAHAGDIVRGIVPALERSDSDTVSRFTVGQGTTGREREAYVAGWIAVGAMLRQGLSLAQVARIPGDAMARAVRQALGA